MEDSRFIFSSALPVAAHALFAWHTRPGALRRLMPPWEKLRILEWQDSIAPGARVVLEFHLGPFRRRWIAEHQAYDDRLGFRDAQVSGPFARWEHTHHMRATGSESAILEDDILYRLPFGRLGAVVAGAVTKRKLERIFRYRHTITKDDLLTHAGYKDRKPMNVIISGASGLVGSALVPFLSTGGHQVARLVRRKPARPDDERFWNPASGEIDASGLEGFDAVVHLAGEGIATSRWTQAKKRRLRESRVAGTRLLAETLAALKRPPKVLVCASAVGYYGDRGDEILTEDNQAGSGFLADVCREWEAACGPAASAGIRVINLRIGVVLSAAGGALGKMLPLFRLGLGGRLGCGKQYVSWIALDDLMGLILHAIMDERLSGSLNAVAPQAVTNLELTKTLGRVLERPTIFPVPAFAARLLLGEMADAALLSSARVEPRRALESGYRFRFSELEAALRHTLGR